MKGLKAAAVSLSLFGLLLCGPVVLCGLRAMTDRELPAAVAAIGFAVPAGFCLLGGAILTAVQPFVPRPPAGS